MSHSTRPLAEPHRKPTPNTEAEMSRLAAIVELSDDAMISRDTTGAITGWNKAAEKMFGYTAEEVMGRPITILNPAGRVDEEPGIIARVSLGERIDHFETVRQRKDGSLINISMSVSPIFNGSGTIVGASKVARDISERKEADLAIRRLAAIVESSDDAIVSKDLNGVITTWNRGAERLFGYSADEAIGQPITILMPAERVSEESSILERVRKGERVDHYETIRRRKDGTLVNISLTVSPITDAEGRIIGASKIARDISERKEIEKATRESEIMLRLIEAQESERRRIARDLHDHVGQEVTALRLKIEPLIEAVADDEAMQKAIGELRDIAERIDRDVGFLSWELRPSELEEFGLEGALQSFVTQWSRQFGIKADFHLTSDTPADVQQRLSRTMETNLYRILQEALNNVVKHADAGYVSVVFHRRKSRVILIVEDDGCGFKTESARRERSRLSGQGMIGMRERATMLKGTFDIESQPRKGTTILVRIPLD